jgi:hypothetical protein
MPHLSQRRAKSPQAGVAMRKAAVDNSPDLRVDSLPNVPPRGINFRDAAFPVNGEGFGVNHPAPEPKSVEWIRVRPDWAAEIDCPLQELPGNHNMTAVSYSSTVEEPPADGQLHEVHIVIKLDGTPRWMFSATFSTHAAALGKDV